MKRSEGEKNWTGYMDMGQEKVRQGQKTRERGRRMVRKGLEMGEKRKETRETK
jgi:hypothetical protein